MSTTTSRPTNKSCSCGGKINELFSVKQEEFTMSTPFGGNSNAWVTSDGFCCEKCGILYGGMQFPKTKPADVPEDVKKELL